MSLQREGTRPFTMKSVHVRDGKTLQSLSTLIQSSVELDGNAQMPLFEGLTHDVTTVKLFSANTAHVQPVGPGHFVPQQAFPAAAHTM